MRTLELPYCTKYGTLCAFRYRLFYWKLKIYYWKHYSKIFFIATYYCLPVFSTWLVYEQCREPAKKHNLYKCKRKRNQLYTNAPFVVFIIEYMLCMCKCFIYLFLKSYLYSYNWHFYFACSCASSKVAYWDVPRSLCLSFDY